MENTNEQMKTRAKSLPIGKWLQALIQRGAGMGSGREELVEALCPSPSSCWLQMALLGLGQLFEGIGFLESHMKRNADCLDRSNGNQEQSCSQ